MSNRKYNEDLWCIQKHLLLANIHNGEGLQKLYRECPAHPSVQILEKKYDDISKLRKALWDKWGNQTKQEQHECSRCIEDLNGKTLTYRERIPRFTDNSLSESQVVASSYNLLGNTREQSLNISNDIDFNEITQENGVTIQNKIIGGDQKMAKGKFQDVLMDVAVIDVGVLLGHAGSLGAEWAGRKICTPSGTPLTVPTGCTPVDPSSGAIDATKKTLFTWQNMIEVLGGLGVQLLSAWGYTKTRNKMQERLAMIGMIAGGTMFGNGIIRVVRENLAVTSQFYRAPSSMARSIAQRRYAMTSARPMISNMPQMARSAVARF